MKNLGKKIFLGILICVATLHAGVTATVEPSQLYEGDMATYTLTIDGGEVNKPIIDDICGNEIIATSSSTSIAMVNGDYTKSYKLSYQFMPRKSCIVNPVSVEVDGKKELSNSVKVEVKPASQEKNRDFTLTLKSSKERVYVGEPFDLTLVLKQSNNAQAVDSQFIEPDFKGFWVKKRYKTSRTQKGDFTITTAKYKLAAQREGNLTIKAAQLRVASRVNTRDVWGSFMPQIKWRSYYSNPLTITAVPLPNNAQLVGDFTLKAFADKTTIHPNEAVNVTVVVKGDGNLEDIKTFKPFLNGVNVFDEKVQIEGDKLTQKLAFVSDRDFTIPPFHLDFYNLKTHKVQRITTQPIEVKVVGGTPATQTQQATPLKVKKAPQMQESIETPTSNTQGGFSFMTLIVGFVVGVACGVLVMVYKPFVLQTKEKKLNIKDEKVLLMKLMEYKDSDQEVAQFVDILEKNIYESKGLKVDKKRLKALLKKYNIA
jgi:hypothetical protein